MKAARIAVVLSLLATASQATTQLILSRDAAGVTTEYKGIVELTVNLGFDDAKVTITVDGQKLADNLRSPYRVTVDFGAQAVEHKIWVTALTADKKRVQWSETINKGLLPLSVKVKAVDAANGIFEAHATSPKEDPIEVVELWDAGALVASVKQPPYRITVPAAVMQTGFVQVTARTKSGEEAADFWSAAGDVHVESVEVRTVPIFVSVVDRDGTTRVDVDRSSFRIIDNDSEAKILEFGKAFDQPISLALLVDASGSMGYEIANATKAATGFVQRTLRDSDRCAVFAIRDVPRRMVELTSDKASVEKALGSIKAVGQTALYDAIETAIRELKDEKNRRAIVILTDGGDTASMASFEDIDRKTREAGIPLYFIAYDTGEVTQSKDLDRLKYLATETGGFVATASQQNLVARYGDIEKDLRAQFAIRYQVTDYAKHNEWRKVRVVLASPKLTARTIRGYFAP
ncbi:MAG TPA: VWA domain-containing protein [Thermoanaerobaculia bacterium]|nr:VWA domain-containing protein [Thermoanaerobaculia bacterium]